MEVMTDHKWYDSDIETAIYGGNDDHREIHFKGVAAGGALILNKKDVIALAKEFGLDVFHGGVRL